MGGLSLPHLGALGLGNIVEIPGVPAVVSPRASFGKMTEVSKGKDSTTGHWELCGLVTSREFPTYPDGFPEELMKRFLAATGCRGYLGNTVASGTAIIQQLGAEHLKTGFPIVYTSADSVFQIAAHEGVVPLATLYDICRCTRDRVCVGNDAVGRVIARPFTGTERNFKRTVNRRDFSLPPHGTTVLDLLSTAGIETVSVGKVDDLFAGRGLKTGFHTTDNAQGIEAIVRESTRLPEGLLFANLVDFDMLYGHRNDPEGFRTALEQFDRELPRILETLEDGDLLVLTADHGNDPVTPSTDHSREYVPLLCFRRSRPRGVNLGVRRTFADVGKTVADFFGVENALAGNSFLGEVC